MEETGIYIFQVSTGDYTEYEHFPEDTYGKDFTCNYGNAQEEDGPQMFRTVFQPLIYSLVFLLGLAGNGLMLTVILTRTAPLRVTEIYLLHLAITDLLLLLTFPFAVAQGVSGWLFGDFLCMTTGLLNRFNLLYGSLLLVCIAVDRYLAIVHAVHSMQSRRPRMVHLTCLVLWLVCLALSAPNLVFLSVKEHPDNSSKLSCNFNQHGINANNWLLTHRFLNLILCFFLPLAVMSFCYGAVVCTLRHAQSSDKRGAIRLSLLITAVFCLVWLPYSITALVDSMAMLRLIDLQSCGSRTRLEQALVVTESLGFSHCCLNPLLYAFVGVRFRSDLANLFSKWGCRRLGLLFTRAQGQGRSSVSEAATTHGSNLI